MAAEIEVRRERSHIEVHFARPGKLNALTAAMYGEAADALEVLNTEPSLHSLVFSGAGTDLCAGNDILEFLADYDLAQGKPWRRFLEGLASAQKTLIAAVQGRAIGIGMTLLLHCDFVYGEPNCRFSAPFGQLGVVPEAGSSLPVPRLVGSRRAADIFILGRGMQAEEALQAGLVTRIVEPGGARAAALDVAARLAQLPPKTVAETIRLLRLNGLGVAERIDDECKAFMACLRTEETRAILARILARTKPELLLDLLTPVVKSWPAEYCLEANKRAIQVLGGYGYTRDHPVERLYRDNRLNMIHEGTHAIQAMDLLGRKIPQQGGAVVRLLATEIERDLAVDGMAAPLAAELLRAWKAIEATIEIVGACPDMRRRLANASLFLDAFGHVVVAWMWLKQARTAAMACGDAGAPLFQAGKMKAAQYFFRYELPAIYPNLALVGALDDTCLEIDPGEFV